MQHTTDTREGRGVSADQAGAVGRVEPLAVRILEGTIEVVLAAGAVGFLALFVLEVFA